MIFLSDDYVTKYQDVLGYLIGRAINEGYALPFIEKTIAYSSVFSNFEKSDITEIAFSSKELIYDKVFTANENDYIYSPYDVYGWLGFIYIHLFFDLKITFETLFFIAPIEKTLEMYHLYHEMDYRQTLEFVKKRINYSFLNVCMDKRNMSSSKLSLLTNIPYSTINALRYGNRSIDKLEAQKLLKIALSLRVKPESLLTDIALDFN